MASDTDSLKVNGPRADDTLRRVEVITGRGRRRHWSDEDKARIVAESLGPGISVSAIARRHDINPGLLFLWRRQMNTSAARKRSGEPDFVPVTITGAGRTHNGREASTIEIEVGEIRIRVVGRVDIAALRDIMTAALAAR